MTLSSEQRDMNYERISMTPNTGSSTGPVLFVLYQGRPAPKRRLARLRRFLARFPR